MLQSWAFLVRNIRNTKSKLSLGIAQLFSVVKGCGASHTIIPLPPFSCDPCLLIHQWPQMEHSVDTGPNYPKQYHPSIGGRQVYCCLSRALVSTLCTSASSLPVVYSNVVRMEQLVVTWGWLCCSHSDIFKGGRGRRRCCLWSVDDSLGCCTSSTLTTAWCEGSRASVQRRVQNRPRFDQQMLSKGNQTIASPCKGCTSVHEAYTYSFTPTSSNLFKSIGWYSAHKHSRRVRLVTQSVQPLHYKAQFGSFGR